MSNRASAIVTIVNRLGLHARPAMTFVERAMEHEASVKVRRVDHNEFVDGKSIMQMMMLAATEGTRIEIVAEGADAEKMVQALVLLVESRFDEE
ncbi:MAG: HPr family phosphocarrier protein [Phycisphaerales bacterium]|nr:HPr family phosphocarrier protein [Phycisphaerales bacterium]